MRLLILEVGGEMEVLAALLLAVVESLLPKRNFHEGPPNCESNANEEDNDHITWKFEFLEEEIKMVFLHKLQSHVQPELEDQHMTPLRGMPSQAWL